MIISERVITGQTCGAKEFEAARSAGCRLLHEKNIAILSAVAERGKRFEVRSAVGFRRLQRIAESPAHLQPAAQTKQFRQRNRALSRTEFVDRGATHPAAHRRNLAQR